MEKEVKAMVTLVMPVKLIAELDAEAQADGRSRASHIRRVLELRKKNHSEYAQALADSVRAPK